MREFHIPPSQTWISTSRGEGISPGVQLAKPPGHYPDRRIGQRDPRLHGRPAEDGRSLEVKEDHHRAEEAFDTGALA
jgi:hypothetical protein